MQLCQNGLNICSIGKVGFIGNAKSSDHFLLLVE